MASFCARLKLALTHAGGQDLNGFKVRGDIRVHSSKPQSCCVCVTAVTLVNTCDTCEIFEILVDF